MMKLVTDPDVAKMYLDKKKLEEQLRAIWKKEKFDVCLKVCDDKCIYVELGALDREMRHVSIWNEPPNWILPPEELEQREIARGLTLKEGIAVIDEELDEISWVVEIET